MSIEFLDVDMTEPFLKDDQDIETNTIFKISKAEIQEMFIYDKTVDLDKDELPAQRISKSLKMLRQLGGTENIARCVRTSLVEGINGDVDDIRRRQKCYGNNVFEKPKIKGFMVHAKSELQRELNIILLCTSVLCIVLGIVFKDATIVSATLTLMYQKMYYYEAFSIFILTIIVVLSYAWINYVKDLKFQDLVMKSRMSNVVAIRGKFMHTVTVDSKELVVGDIIQLESGQQVPADCLLVKKSPILYSDDELFNGVKNRIPKEILTEANYYENPNPFLFAGTYIIQGSCYAMVCSVGTSTYLSSKPDNLNFEDNLTSTQKQLRKITGIIHTYSKFMAFLIFAILCTHTMLAVIFNPRRNFVDKFTFQEITSHVSTVIALMIVAIPDGLVLSISMGLIFQLSTSSICVNNIQALEKIGGVQELVISKSGILTKNEDGKVYNLFFEGRLIQNDVENRFQGEDFKVAKQLLLENILYNSHDGRVEMDETAELKAYGNFVDCALWMFYIQNDFEIPINHRVQWEEKKACYLPMNLYRMRTTAGIYMQDEDGQTFVRLYTKGAPEYVISLCSNIIEEGGQVNDLDDDLRNSYINEVVIDNISKKGHKAIAFAYRDIPEEQFREILLNHFEEDKEDQFQDALEQDMTFMGVIGIADPLRPEVKGLMNQCTEARVNVRLVSNDDLHCTKTIAYQLGLINRVEYNNQDVCMDSFSLKDIVGGMRDVYNEQHEFEGMELRKKKTFRLLSQKLKVVGRSTPDIKYLIVTGLMDYHLVAVTCNDHQDLASVTKADVGIANGRELCNEMLRDKSDVILLSESLDNILLAIKQGRTLNANCIKFLQFQLTLNLVAISVILTGSLLYGDPILTPVQQLWINIVIDLLASLALCSEPPNDMTLKTQGPLERNQSIVSPLICRNAIVCASYQTAILIIILIFGKTIFQLDYNMKTEEYSIDSLKPSDKLFHYTIIFNIMFFMTIFQLINSRKISHLELNPFADITKNYIFLAICCVVILLQIIIVQFGGLITNCAPLSLYQQSCCVLISVPVLFVGLAVKFIPEEPFALMAAFFSYKTENYNEEEDSIEEDIYIDLETHMHLQKQQMEKAKKLQANETKASASEPPQPEEVKKQGTLQLGKKKKPYEENMFEELRKEQEEEEEQFEEEYKQKPEEDELLSLVNALGGVEQQKSDLGTDRSDLAMGELVQAKIVTEEFTGEKKEDEDEYEYQLEYYDEEQPGEGEQLQEGEEPKEKPVYHKRIKRKRR